MSPPEGVGCLCRKRRPPRGERPNEGQVIARKFDGTPVVDYSFSSPLETMQSDVEGMVIMPVKAWGS
jgi:hypothetical protein